MNVFEAVKQSVTTRQAAEFYGFRVNRAGMIACPFHNDRTPSMKVDKRFHCFGCGADGDAVDFVSRLFELPSKEAAMKLADDFGIAYDRNGKPSIVAKIREPTAKQKFEAEEKRCFRVLSDYFHKLRAWEKDYACLAVRQILWTSYPLTAQATAVSCRSWFTPKEPRCISSTMRKNPEPTFIRCGQKQWRSTEAETSSCGLARQ